MDYVLGDFPSWLLTERAKLFSEHSQLIAVGYRLSYNMRIIILLMLLQLCVYKYIFMHAAFIFH